MGWHGFKIATVPLLPVPLSHGTGRSPRALSPAVLTGNREQRAKRESSAGNRPRPVYLTADRVRHGPPGFSLVPQYFLEPVENEEGRDVLPNAGPALVILPPHLCGAAFLRIGGHGRNAQAEASAAGCSRWPCMSDRTAFSRGISLKSAALLLTLWAWHATGRDRGPLVTWVSGSTNEVGMPHRTVVQGHSMGPSCKETMRRMRSRCCTTGSHDWKDCLNSRGVDLFAMLDYLLPIGSLSYAFIMYQEHTTNIPIFTVKHCLRLITLALKTMFSPHINTSLMKRAMPEK